MCFCLCVCVVLVRVNEQVLPAIVGVLGKCETHEYVDGEKDDRVASEYERGRAPLDDGRSERRVSHDGRQCVRANHDEAREKGAELDTAARVRIGAAVAAAVAHAAARDHNRHWR